MSRIIEGVVVGGNKLGRKFGFPTANIHVGDDLDMANGVYSARVTVCGITHNAVANLGFKPSISSCGTRVLEVNIFDFDSDIYDQKIVIELLDFVRDERTFDSFDALREQIAIDKELVAKKFKNI